MSLILRFARCMHQYVDKPRLHANYSLTELIFVIVTKLRNFVNSSVKSSSRLFIRISQP